MIKPKDCMTQKNKVISKRNKAMVKVYATNPKLTKTDAYKMTHKVNEGTKEYSLHQQASEAFRNPLVRSELDKYSNLSEETVVNTVSDYKDSNKQWKRVLAVDGAKWMHDKIHGKATQRTESVSTVVNLNLDLTSKQG